MSTIPIIKFRNPHLLSIEKIEVITTLRVYGVILLTLGLSVISAAAVPPATEGAKRAKPMIPDLNWEPRSDWVNVKTDITPAAVGDGMADDTAALQAALNSIKSGTTIYLPAGKYRITKTLDFNQERPLGVTIIGHGRSTVIRWDGESGGRILWVHGGAVHTRYVGLTWDGGGKAAVGIDHASKTFETEVTHQHEAFLNFTDAGIRIGYQDKESSADEKRMESAEMEYNNCLFQECRRGVAILNFNDYDNTFDGCEFRQCGTGVQDSHGNIYVRDSHFEESSIVDLSIGSEHASSVRRCTSTGSFRFIELTNFVISLTIQDCHVAGWKSAEGAIQLNGGPVMLFDCTFAESDGGGTPVQLETNEQRLLLSNNTVVGGGNMVKGGSQSNITTLPDGKRGGVIKSAAQSFLKETVVMPPKIFDAKRDFGAIGNGINEDTAALQKTIDAARQYGRGAVAYLPTGSYLLRNTLQITGANYTIAGSGFRTCIVWEGAAAGTIVSVVNPDHVTMEYLNVGSHDAGNMVCGVDIEQTGSEQPSHMTYNHVSVFGMYQKKPNTRGLWFTGLAHGSVVHMRHIQGNLRFNNAAQATILADTSYEGSVTVEGKDKSRDGFLGFQMRLSTLTTHGLYVRDNQSVVFTDYYIEQADDGLLIQGNEGDPEGRIVIQGAKIQSKAGPITIDNYAGTILFGHNQYYGSPTPAVISISGTRPLDLIFASNLIYKTTLEFRNGNKQARVSLISNQQKGQPKESKATLNDRFPEEVAAKTATMLDDLRRLGQTDIDLNYPELAETKK